MLENTYKENVCADVKTKTCLDTAGQSSLVDTESEHLFHDTDRTNEITKAINDNLTFDMDDLDIPDTLTLARLDRENQGPWEAEYSYGGEADLHRHLDNCGKNPGHKNFIPVDQFRMEDLPEGFRRKAIMDYIRAHADLTVRVTVKYVSDRRPATVPGSNKPYPGCGYRGQNKMTVGTGSVFKVGIFHDQQGHTCKCKECRNSPTPETSFAHILIVTGKHVVFDDLEADYTTCHLFFDRGGTSDTCSGVVTLTGMVCMETDILTDKCVMQHYTHDLDLGDRLRKTCTGKNDLRATLCKTPPLITHFKRSVNVADKQPLSFIVSHPHGCSKHISIGRWTSVSGTETNGYTYEYTTATCPGSSGAQVFMQDTFTPESERPIVWFTPRIHSRMSEELPGVNFFIHDFDESRMVRNEDDEGNPDWMKLERIISLRQEYERHRREIKYVRIYPILGGSGEENLSCLDEEGLHTHDDTCQKNPGHQN